MQSLVIRLAVRRDETGRSLFAGGEWPVAELRSCVADCGSMVQFLDEPGSEVLTAFCDVCGVEQHVSPATTTTRERHWRT